MEKGINDRVSDCSYCTLNMFIFIELMRCTQFNAVFFASSTSNIRQPAKRGIMGDLTPLQPIAVNIHIYLLCFYGLYKFTFVMIVLHALAQAQIFFSEITAPVCRTVCSFCFLFEPHIWTFNFVLLLTFSAKFWRK